MLGFFKFKKCVTATAEAVTGLFGPARISGSPYGSIPNAVFGDAYIIGFLQSFSVYVMHEVRGETIKPEEQLAMFSATLDTLVPSLGKQVIGYLPQLNDPANGFHANYSVGRREGQSYVDALRAGDEVAVQSYIRGFTDFIKRNYLGSSN